MKKIYKLHTHQKSFNTADLVLNPKEHPNAKIGDVVEIYDPDDENCKLLLQVTAFSDVKARELISIDSTIASTFNLKTYSDVVMRIVDAADVALDSIEITFKDYYMGRSEMWRLKMHLTNKCVYIKKRIMYQVEKCIRCHEMWSQGDRVSCGVITEDTKIVFRSSSSMVYLFLQMSSEMWDFDIHGDLYFEKAVNGFLTELFTKWKEMGCNHEVTIVLFSRTFYAAKSLEEFPEYMHDCLQMDYKGRFYEDFYRVAVQNERNDDWCLILMQLRKVFTSYQSTVLRYHERENVRIPTATNSTAAQGNFLETLNISLNTFEKHYLDRSFDRTGQLSVVITPGVGVFEVDRELTNITKQRIIDNGVGSDLVCVGEQPLHAVPLLKFHNKDTSLTSADDYSLPHWINLSFYSTNKKVAYSTFIPRIKLTPLVAATVAANENNKDNARKFLSCKQSEYIHNSLFDYDAHDAQIFQLPPAQGTCSLQRVIRAKKTSVPSLETYIHNSCDWENSSLGKLTNMRRKMSDPDIHHGTSGVLSTLTGSPNLSESIASDKNVRRNIVSIAPIVRPGRALINPFDPSHVTIKLTSNRRRWTHIFPKGPTGVLIQQHHYQAVPTKQLSNNHSINNSSNNNNTENYSSGFNSMEYDHTSNCSSMSRSFASSNEDESPSDIFKKRNSHMSPSGTGTGGTGPAKSLTFLWGATGEQEWTPALTTGVDWKSLTIPACLPITTDYFPDARSLHSDYVISDYTLLPDSVNSDSANNRTIHRKTLTTDEVFKEIVSQRLAQGFQLIGLEDKSQGPAQAPCCGGLKQKQQQQQQQLSSVLKTKPPPEVTEEYLLSIGRIFHKISLKGSEITVTGYKPRHPYPPINVDYRYRFHAPQHDTYEISGVNFTTEKLENFNWNYMDHYICTRGDTDYPLIENLKYWRYRMYLLPRDSVAMKNICDHGFLKCDIFSEPNADVAKQQIDEFLRFMEEIKKLKRPQGREARDSPTATSHLTRRRHSTSIISRAPPNQGLGNSPFRERVGSNRLPDKRPSFISRPGSKPLERGRVSPAADAAVIALNSELNPIDHRDSAFVVETKLSPNASLLEIFEAMKHPTTGVEFFMQTPGLPSCTFMCFDALMWLKARLDGTKNPLDILETMRKERMICHASGDWNQPVIPGFYLYYINIQDKKDFKPPMGDLSAFENEWMEVELQGYKPFTPTESAAQDVYHKIPNFLRNTPPPQTWCTLQRQRNIYKQSHLEIDANNRSNRMEWGHVKYHSVMQPGHAFEMVVQWLTASGPIVYDLIYGWQRKAQRFGFQLVPVPADPLAEPFTEKSDPLRGPIFIPLNIGFLGNDNTLFEEFAEETRGDRMLLFQEAILARYGFMPCVVENKYSFDKDLPKEYQYVHCSGNMFVLIRCSKGNHQMKSPGRLEANVTRLVYGHTSHTNVPKKVGFLWSWNHMIANKKWKSLVINCSPEGELFQLKMLKDFKEFCANQDQRLNKFWNDCYQLKKEYMNLENGTDEALRT